MFEYTGIFPLLIGAAAAATTYAIKRNYFNPLALASMVLGLLTYNITYSPLIIGICIGAILGHTLISAYDLIVLPLTGKVKDFGNCEFTYGQVVKTAESQTHHASTTVSEGVFGTLQANTDYYSNNYSSKAIKTDSGQLVLIHEVNDISNAEEGDFVIYAGGKGDRQFAFYNITKQRSQVSNPPRLASVIGGAVFYSIPYIGTIVAAGGLIMASGFFKLKANILDTKAMPRDKGHYIFAFTTHLLICAVIMKTANRSAIGETAFNMILSLGVLNAIHFTAWYIDTKLFKKYLEATAAEIIRVQHAPKMNQASQAIGNAVAV